MKKEISTWEIRNKIKWDLLNDIWFLKRQFTPERLVQLKISKNIQYCKDIVKWIQQNC